MPNFDTQLLRITAGNPFFILELLQNMLEGGQDPADLANSEHFPLPKTVLQTIETRLGRLSPIARQLLEAVAVCGPSFSFELAVRTSGRSELESGTALDELISHHLLEELDGQYSFQHEIIRAAVYRRTTHWRKRLLHRRIAQALQELEPDNYAALAWHYKRGELYRQAAENMLMAGRRVKYLFAYQEARNYFESALELLDREAFALRQAEGQTGIWRLLIQALAERGWVFRLLGDMRSYEADLQREAQIVFKLGDQTALVHLRWREAVAHRWFCRYLQALESARQGLHINQASNDPLMAARLQREVGLALREVGDYPGAQHALEISLDLFEQAGDTIMVVHTLGNLSTLYGHQRLFDEAMYTANRALEICDDLQLDFERRLPLGDMGAVAVGMCQFDQGYEWLSESLKIARQIDDRTQEIFCLAHLGWLYLCKNQSKKAHENFQAALALAKKIDSRAEQSRLHIGLSMALNVSGDRQGALQHARQALAVADRQGQRSEIEHARRMIETAETN